MKKEISSESSADGDCVGGQETFVRLMALYQNRVFAFILTMVPDWNDADEILQETSIILWKKFSEFEIGTDFGKWANAVARIEIRRFFDKKRRGRKILSDEVIAVLHKNFDASSQEFDERGAALRGCLRNLRKKDFKLIFSRYYSQKAMHSIAAQHGRSVESICNSLRRIRNQLLRCVQQELGRK